MDDLDFPRFERGDLSDELMQVAAQVSMAGIFGMADILLATLKEHAIDWMLHVNEDGDYCLHLPHIFGDAHALVT